MKADEEDKRVSPLEGLGMSVETCLTMKWASRYAIYRNEAPGWDAGRYHLVAAPMGAPERMTSGAGWDASQDYRLVGYLYSLPGEPA